MVSRGRTTGNRCYVGFARDMPADTLFPVQIIVRSRESCCIRGDSRFLGVCRPALTISLRWITVQRHRGDRPAVQHWIRCYEWYGAARTLPLCGCSSSFMKVLASIGFRRRAVGGGHHEARCLAKRSPPARAQHRCHSPHGEFLGGPLILATARPSPLVETGGRHCPERHMHPMVLE
jgi:hypothetical protein